jgi:predicted acyltransferase
MFWITGGDAFFITLFALIGTPFFQSLVINLEHPPWSGFRFYDLIFPLFLFIMGLSMPFSITRRLEKGSSKADLYRHVIRRTVVLYLLGMVYNGLFGFDFANLRYTGVLHRIAFTYLFASLIVINCRQKGQLGWSVAITLGYWLILLLVPVPGFGRYDLTPEGNLAGYLDRRFLPGSFCCYPFGDNEGLLTNFPAIVNVLAGSLTGYRLLRPEPVKTKMLFLILTGVCLVGLSLIWELVLPVNKYLWTGSYVSLTSGLSILALCLFYWLIDVKGWSAWSFPFRVIGMNCIIIYVIQGIFDFGIIARIFIHGFDTKLGVFQPVFYEFCVLTVKWLFLYFLYRQKIFLKV